MDAAQASRPEGTTQDSSRLWKVGVVFAVALGFVMAMLLAGHLLDGSGAPGIPALAKSTSMRSNSSRTRAYRASNSTNFSNVSAHGDGAHAQQILRLVDVLLIASYDDHTGPFS
jgi:hypothetical protein